MNKNPNLRPSVRASVRAFLLGMREFRSDFTTYFDGSLIETYDRGREIAHQLTFRHWDTNR